MRLKFDKKLISLCVTIQAILSIYVLPLQAQANRVGTDHFAGLNDTDSPDTLQDDEAQAVLNVESNISGTGILKRGGYQQIAQLPISTSAVTGAYHFIDKNGNLQVIVCENSQCYHSVNNSAFTVIYGTATLGHQRYSFADVNGVVYGVDDKGDQPWSYDGTTFSQPFSTSAPQSATLIELSKDRLILSGVSTNPNQIYYSQSGVYTNFNTGPNSGDPWTDQFGTYGQQITAIKYNGGNLYIFKQNSITLCILQDQYSTQCYPVSDSIGTNSPASIVSAPDGIYFQSQYGSYWRIPYFGIYGIELVSKRISNFVKSQPSQFGSTGFNFQGQQSDWNAGVQAPTNTWNTASIPGSIFDSSNTFSDFYTTATLMANISTPTFLVQLTSSVAYDNFADGDFTTGQTTWTVGDNIADNVNWSIVSANGQNYLSPLSGAQDIASSNNRISSGSWAWTFMEEGTCCPGCECWRTKFAYDKNGNNYGVLASNDGADNFTIDLFKNNGVSDTVFASSNVGNFAPFSNQNFIVTRSSVGFLTMSLNGVFIGSSPVDTTTIFPPSYGFRVKPTGAAHTWGMTNFYWYQFPSSGTFISQEFDTTFTTPTWGPFSSTFSVNSTPASGSEGLISFYTQTSTSPNNDMYDARVAVSDTVKIQSSGKRFIRYEEDFVNYMSTKTPVISALSLPYATTGQFRTQCIQTGANITSYGTLTCDNSNNVGAGSEIFYATSAVSCAALPSGPPQSWVSPIQTNRQVLTIAVSSAVYIGFASLLGSATDQAQINSCSLNWNNGITPQPVFGALDPVKNAIFWTTSNNQLGKNNRILKYDLNLALMGRNPWFPWSINATALRYFNNSLFFGSASSGTWNQIQNAAEGGSDNGSVVNAIWQSKDFSCMAPFQDSSWKREFLVTKNQMGGTLNITANTSLGGTDSYSVSLSTISGLNYVRAVHNLKLTSPAAFINTQFGNTAANQQFEINGIGFDCFANPPYAANP